MIDIVARLKRAIVSAPDIYGNRSVSLLNPDGEDAIKEIERLRAALEQAEDEIEHLRTELAALKSAS